MKVAILGAGAWGSALAIALASRHEVRLWTRDAAAREAIRATRRSPRLPDFTIPDSVAIADDAAAVAASELFLLATATEGLGATLRQFAPVAGGAGVLWACKGFEASTGRLPHEVVASVLPQAARVGALSGPSFAREVAQGLPTALVASSLDAAFARSMAAALNGPRMRVYSSTDLVGAELGGAVKNVIAIATGISDGLGLGANARAALVTRGLAEIARLGERLGGQPDTFRGLTGLGDLVLTATGDLSRNRTVGLRLARGEALEAVLAAIGHVAEGVASARTVRDLARRLGLEMPITEMVCSVLFDGLDPREAAGHLLARDPRPE